MNSVMWAVQSNLISANQVEQITSALLKHNIKCVDVVVIPFSDKFGSEVITEGHLVIPYGSTKLSKLAIQRGWKGLFFDDYTFRVDVWNENRPDMLNNDAQVMTVKQAADSFATLPQDDKWFIRPVEDLKAFAGTVTTASEISNWMKSTDSGNFSFTEQTPIVVAKVKEILCEWRYFVVGGKIISGSVYRHSGQLYSKQELDPEIIQEAQQLADIWLPHETCVMDVALTPEGLKVIEFNAFNSSGFYDHDVEAIVLAATHYMLSL